MTGPWRRASVERALKILAAGPLRPHELGKAVYPGTKRKPQGDALAAAGLIRAMRDAGLLRRHVDGTRWCLTAHGMQQAGAAPKRSQRLL